MAVDMLLKIDGIKGESVIAKHEDEIDVLSWHWGATQSGTRHKGPGGGQGKVSVQDLTIEKYVDAASSPLFLACCNGKHIREATLVLRKAGENPLDYAKIKMTDLLVAGVSTGGTTGDDRVKEHITLNFAMVEYEYTPQKADGSAGAAITNTFDIAKNEKT